MGISLGSHELVKWEHSEVSATLKSSDGTTIACRKCQIVLTNQHIHIVPSRPATYTVANKGDRTLRQISIPLRIAKPHRLIQPWFGPYKWETVISGQLPNSDIEPQNTQWRLVLTFISGGVFEYRNEFMKAFADSTHAAQDGMEEILPPYSEV